MNQNERERDSVNPAARRDRPGEPHDDLVENDPANGDRPPKSYQEGELEPRDQGGIAE
jgi:hypothetical protein